MGDEKHSVRKPIGKHFSWITFYDKTVIDSVGNLGFECYNEADGNQKSRGKNP